MDSSKRGVVTAFGFDSKIVENQPNLLQKEDVVNVLEEGQTIRHEQYGVGTVTESTTERTTVDFDNHGMKKFITSIWTAEIIGETAAERPRRRRTRRKTARK